MICFGLEELICNVSSWKHHKTPYDSVALLVLCQGFFAGSNWIIQGWEFYGANVYGYTLEDTSIVIEI